MLDRTLKHGLDYNMCMIVHRGFHDGLPGLLLGALVVVGCSGPSLDMRASCGAAVVEHDRLPEGGSGGLRATAPCPLRLTQVSSGWFDAGPDSLGRNKLVPSVSFRLENSTDDIIRHVQLNAVFRRQGEEEAWGDAYVRAFGTEGLDAGQATQVFRLESGRGYTGEQEWSEMLEHRDFVDVEMDLFVKHRGNEWVKLVDAASVDRQLLMR